jgi:hypothetical protein
MSKRDSTGAATENVPLVLPRLARGVR